MHQEKNLERFANATEKFLNVIKSHKFRCTNLSLCCKQNRARLKMMQGFLKKEVGMMVKGG